MLFLCLIAAAVSGGCAGKSEEYSGGQGADGRKSGITAPAGSEVITALSQQEKKGTEAEPVIEEVDYSAYFEGLNGAAVIYDPSENRYQIYNQETALTQRSPCSTFKIISSLIGLENGIIVPEDSVRPWSGEIFWNEDWNRDIGFEDAFRTSCVWYFRQVIDEIGTELMQEELDRLQYGNRDISDWEGRQNTNDDNRALTGFWIESSLRISPKEQTEVMERIFGSDSEYSKGTQDKLKEVMLVSGQSEPGLAVYGKTGQGAEGNTTVDCWFTGFADQGGEQDLLLCVPWQDERRGSIRCKSEGDCPADTCRLLKRFLCAAEKTFKSQGQFPKKPYPGFAFFYTIHRKITLQQIMQYTYSGFGSSVSGSASRVLHV